MNDDAKERADKLIGGTNVTQKRAEEWLSRIVGGKPPAPANAKGRREQALRDRVGRAEGPQRGRR